MTRPEGAAPPTTLEETLALSPRSSNSTPPGHFPVVSETGSVLETRGQASAPFSLGNHPSRPPSFFGGDAFYGGSRFISPQAPDNVALQARMTASTGSAQAAVEQKLSERPVDIRDAARALSQEFTEQVEELKRSKPNDPGRLAEHDSLVAFFERMAAGLGELADALDKAISGAGDGKPDPIFLGRAGTIAEHLHLALMEWLEENRTMLVDVPIRIGLFGLGTAVLHSIAADSVTAIGSLAWLLRRPAKSGKTSRKRQATKPRSRGKQT